MTSANSIYKPLFDPFETERVAWRLRFDSRKNVLAREIENDPLLMCSIQPHTELTAEQYRQARRYVAVGLYLWLKFGDQGQPLPAPFWDWYRQNTALMNKGELFTPVYARDGGQQP